MGRNWKKHAVFMISIPLLFAAALAGWQVDCFQIYDEKGDLIFSAPAANGNKFTTRYVHSVERTPVEDEYRIVGGRIWIWEERVRSSNAGLPSMKPQRGSFIESGEWFIYRGGRKSVSEYYYRIGNELFGLNQADFEPFGRRDFYRAFKGERLRVAVRTVNLLSAKVFVSEKLSRLPAGVPAVLGN